MTMKEDGVAVMFYPDQSHLISGNEHLLTLCSAVCSEFRLGV